MKQRYLRFMTLNLWGENGPWEERLSLVRAKLISLPDDGQGLPVLDPDNP